MSNYLNPFDDAPTAVAQIINAAEGKGKFIMYFHGGLSPASYITDTLGPELMSTIFSPQNLPDAHALMLQWETGIVSWGTLINMVEEIVDSAGKEKIDKVIEWLKSKLGLDHARKYTAFAPTDENEEMRRTAKALYAKLSESKGVRALRAAPPSEKEMAKSLQEMADKEALALFAEIDESVYGGGAKAMAISPVTLYKLASVLLRVIKRLAKDRGHGLGETVVEEMCRFKFFDVLKMEDLAEGHWVHVCEHADEMWQMESAKALLRALDRRCGADPSFKIDLVCHSAGSIAICGLIRHLRGGEYGNLAFNNVIFIAPAARMKLFEDEIVNAPKGRIKNFRMYTLDDKHEAGESLIPVIYTNSLLYFVSGVAEKEGDGDMSICGMHRYLDGRKPYNETAFNNENKGILGDLKACREFLSSSERLVLSPNENAESRPGFVTEATGHENSKRPSKCPQLGKSLIYVLSDGATAPNAVDTSNWERFNT